MGSKSSIRGKIFASLYAGQKLTSQIHTILTTKEGEDLVEYRENVLHAWL
jgi:hypothetical protein